jgi:hypothetical protein
MRAQGRPERESVPVGGTARSDKGARIRLAPRTGLFGSIAICLVAYLGLAACATTQQQTYVDWIAVRNPSAICKDKPDCVQHSTWRGKPLCTIVTADKDVSYARLGQQVRECLL